MPWEALYYHDGESAACTKFISVYDYSGLNIGGKNYFKTPIHPMWPTAITAAAMWPTSTPSSPPARRSAGRCQCRHRPGYAPSEGTFFHFADYRTGEVDNAQG